MEFGWWFVVLWSGVVVLSLWSKSVTANFAMMAMSIAGCIMVLDWGDVVWLRYGLSLIFGLVGTFALVQMLTRCERL